MSLIPGEKAVIQSGDLKLEALLHLPDGEGPFPGIVICHPHPQYGGDMYNGVVGALAKAATASGCAAIRFNFRGVGQSEGRYEDGVGEITDVGAAVDHLVTLAQIDPARVALAGYSFGATMALNYANSHPDLAAVVAVSQPTFAGARVEINLDPPLLIVAGDRDQYCDVDLLSEYRSQLGKDVTLEVVPGVDHFWWGSFDRLEEVVLAFLARHLAAPVRR